MKIIKTKMLTRYMYKLAVRVFIFLAVFLAYLTHKEVLYEFITHEFTFGILEHGISPLHVLWLVFMVMMFFHLFPHEKLTIALRKEESVCSCGKLFRTGTAALCAGSEREGLDRAAGVAVL